MKKFAVVFIVVVAMAALMTAPVLAADQTGMKKSDKMGMKMGDKMGMMQSSMHSQPFASTVRASELIGRDVVNQNEEELGSVEDVVIGRDGRVSYLVVAHGGVMGVGDNLIPVPFSAIEQQTSEKDNIVLNMSKEELEKAPNFAANEWPDFSDPTYENDVHGYFGASPAGTQGTMSGQESKTPGGLDVGTQSGEPGGKDEIEGKREIDNPVQTPAPKKYD